MSKWISGPILAIAVGLVPGAGSTAARAAPTGVFRFADEVKLVTMDPHKHTGGGMSYDRPVYESLFQAAPGGTARPLLATGYKIDGRNVEITLRKGVKYSDGEPLDAAAAAANINRGVKIGILAALKPVEKAVATGDYTFTIKLKGPDPSIITDLTGPAGMMIAPKAMNDPALDRNPVGTGPYVYDKADSREGEVRVYTPNLNYWDPKEQGLKRLEIYEMPDDTARLNALKTGQVDAGIWLSNPQSAIIDRTPGLKLIRNTVGLTYHLVISDRAGSKVPAFADKRVRQAMAYAIDRKAFSKAIDFGLSTPVYQPYPKGTWEHDPALENRFKYNPKKAKELLKEAGYPDGFTFTMPSIPIFQSRLEAVAGFLKDVGITMKIQPVEPGTLAKRSRTTDFPATNLAYASSNDPKYLATYFTGKDGLFNPYKVAPSPEVAKLSGEGLHATGVDARKPIYDKLFTKLDDESYLIFITWTPVLFGVSDAVANNPTVKYRSLEDTVILRGLTTGK